MRALLGTQKLAHAQPSVHSNKMPYKFDLADVKGQLRPRRALEIAAAGDTPCSLKDHQAQVKLYWPHACLQFYRHFLLKKLLKLQVFILFQIHHILLGSVRFARPTIQHQQLHWLGAVVIYKQLCDITNNYATKYSVILCIGALKLNFERLILSSKTKNLSN